MASSDYEQEEKTSGCQIIGKNYQKLFFLCGHRKYISLKLEPFLQNSGGVAYCHFPFIDTTDSFHFNL